MEVNRTALHHFLRTSTSITPEIIHFLTTVTQQVIQCEPSANSGCRDKDNKEDLPSLPTFISSVITNSHVPISTLLTSTIYLTRLQSRLPADARGMRCTAHRIFLSCLILAAKNHNDAHPFNRQWAKYTRISSTSSSGDMKNGKGFPGFSLRDVNLMERQLLFLLAWDLRVTEDQLMACLEPFLLPVREAILLDLAEW